MVNNNNNNNSNNFTTLTPRILELCAHKGLLTEGCEYLGMWKAFWYLPCDGVSNVATSLLLWLLSLLPLVLLLPLLPWFFYINKSAIADQEMVQLYVLWTMFGTTFRLMLYCYLACQSGGRFNLKYSFTCHIQFWFCKFRTWHQDLVGFFFHLFVKELRVKFCTYTINKIAPYSTVLVCQESYVTSAGSPIVPRKDEIIQQVT